METKKSRVFTKKLIALFLAVVMALSCFTGAMAAFAASVEADKKYYDNNLAANFMTWAETTDEQTAEALLDWADMHLDELILGLNLNVYMNESGAEISVKGDKVDIKVKELFITIADIHGYIDNVDGIYHLLKQVDATISANSGLIGDLGGLSLSPISNLKTTSSGEYVTSKCGVSYRGANSAKELIMALAECIYKNSNSFSGGKNVIGTFLGGKMSLGTILNLILGKSIYALLQDALGMWDGYESDIVYNIVSNLILSNTKWFDDKTTEDYYTQLKSGNRTTFKLDDILFDALNRELLQKISVLVTYPTLQTGEDAEVDEDGNPVSESSWSRAKKLGISIENPSSMILDSGIVYSDEFIDKVDGVTPMNVYLFQYDDNHNGVIEDDEKLVLDPTDSLFNFAFKALEFAWKTVLQDTLGLVHVNNDTDRGHGSNFDNHFYYWMIENSTWDTDDWTKNYTMANVQAWADAVYEEYDAKDRDEFIGWVKHVYDYDRSVVADAKGNWRDIDATKLFAELRYSPLADLVFDMQTGPINLYFMQTGIGSISEFFDTAFDKYDNMINGLNDALVAVTDVIFVESDNIGYQSTDKEDARKPAESLEKPVMNKTGNLDGSISENNTTIATTFVDNFMAMFEYAANAADANILNSFYTNNKISTTGGNLNEGNMEEAMIPLLISCINQIKMTNPIHDARWDEAVDAEGVAIIALEEYLAYVLPDKDYTPLWQIVDGKMVANPGENLFENAVLPMVRDAVSYLVQSIVPCRDANGNEWNVYKRAVNDKTTIFDILNSVIVYYGSADGYGATVTQSNGVKLNNSGKAVASLLGAVNGDGTNLLSYKNSIWQNIDAVANKLLPILGVFQYGDKAHSGKFSSEKLLYKDLIDGILNIANVKESGKQGITNLVIQLLTICTADPISNNYGGQSLVVMIYDILADEINTIFGARYDGMGYAKVVPNSDYYEKDSSDKTNSRTPFDSLITVDTLAKYSQVYKNGAWSDDGKSTGILGILICNIFEAFGGGGYSTQADKSKIWTGAMFAVDAVNNFIPSFVPQLSDHFFNAATATIANPSQNGKKSGAAFTATTLDIVNNATGINRFYRGANGQIEQMGRYFVEIADVTATNAKTGAAVSNIQFNTKTGTIAPGKKFSINVSGTAPSAATTYAVKVKYNVWRGTANQPKGSIWKSDLETTTYMYITPEVDWQQTVYPADRVYSGDSSITMFASDYEVSGTGNTSTYTFGTAKQSRLWATFPKDFIIKMSDPSASNGLGIRIKNDYTLGGRELGYDGIITYIKAGTQYYSAQNSTEISETLSTQGSDNKKVAYAAIDPQTGDILNYNYYDYSIDGGETWVRKDQGTYGNIGKHGFTADEINNVTVPEGQTLITRPHHVYTLEEALAAKMVYGVQRRPASVVNGKLTYVYDAVLIDFNSAACQTTYDGDALVTHMLSGDTQDSMSCGTPTPGIYMSAGHGKVGNNKSVYVKFLQYDGATALKADDYDMPVCVYRNDGQNMSGTVHVYIADDSAANTLGRAYENAAKQVSTYMEKDMADFDGTSSQIYKDVQDALAHSVEVEGTPINSSNAGNIGSKMEETAVTSWTTDSIHGDIAYKPLSTQVAVPGQLITKGAVKGSDNYWYMDEDNTLPIYSNEKLTADDVTDDKNAVGEDVVADEYGDYHLVNAPVYEQDWDTTTYKAPYRYNTDVQRVDDDGKLLYDAIQFIYYTEAGDQVSSHDNWAFKIADKHSTIVPNSGTENRGIFQQAADNMDYYLEQMKKHINAALANKVGEIKENRKGMNNVNYEIASYEKMAQVGRDTESLIWEEYEEDDVKKENPTYVTDRSSLEIDAAVDTFNTYMDLVHHRNYDENIGDKIEKEIKCATKAVTGTEYTYDQVKATPIMGTNEDTSEEEVVSYNITLAGAPLENVVLGTEDVYTEESWTAYCKALGDAVETINAAVIDNTDADVSDIYTKRCNLMIAENELTVKEAEPSADTITVSGTITIAEDIEGTEGEAGIVGINVMLDGEVVATSAADGTFEAVVPVGTTELTLTGDTTVDRTVTLAGTANVSDVIIPIVVCNYYKEDTAINSSDVAEFAGYIGSDYVYANLYSEDNIVNSSDVGIFTGFIDSSIVYAEMNLE